MARRRAKRRHPQRKAGSKTAFGRLWSLTALGIVVLVVVAGVYAFQQTDRNAGLASATSSDQPAPITQTARSTQSQSPPIANLAPNITLTTLQGEFSVGQKRGEALVLYFSFVG